MSEELFGPLIDGDLVERAVIEHLQTWMPTYLTEIERRREWDEGTLPLPRSWNPVSEDESSRWPEHQVPAAMVISPGIGGQPVKEGDGAIGASYEVAIGIVVSGKDEHETRLFAHLYAAAVRWVMLQKPGFSGTELEDSAAGVIWLDESPMPDQERRTLWASRQAFAIEVDGVLNADMGPAEPAPPVDLEAPYSAETVTVETVDRQDD